MRRLCIVQLLPALDSGGVERSTLEIGRALVAAGHRSVVISAGGRLLPRLQAEGSEHIGLAIGAKSLRTLTRVGALRTALAALQPDVVHARSRLPAWLAIAALRGLPAPKPHLVTSVHGLNSPGWYGSALTRGEKVICVSETVRAHVLRQWPQTDAAKLRVIEPGIDPQEFPRDFRATDDWRRDFLAQYPSLHGGKLLLLPGRGTRLKGHATAIELLAQVRDAGVDARLCLFGAREPGREKYLAELEALAARLNVADALAITPPRPDIRDAYSLADVVLQLSEQPEAFGRTVLEALAIGRPVLGWEHGGVGDLLRRYYPAGVVAWRDRPQLLTRALALLQAPPAVSSTLLPMLSTMQQQTLELYASFA
jgi:glycosyltransferase involved in cell wall biosynthesis